MLQYPLRICLAKGAVLRERIRTAPSRPHDAGKAAPLAFSHREKADATF